MKKFTILILLAVFGLSGFAQIQANFSPTDDVWVEELSPTTNHGSTGDMYIGRDPGGEGNHTLIKWDISSLPNNITINSAEIHIWEWVSSSGTIPCGYIKRITETWNEGSTTWDNQPNVSSSYGTVCFSDMSSSGWYVMDYSAITDLVNDWITYGNYGVMFQAASTNNGYKTFDSKEGTHAPVLKIFYTINTGNISENSKSEFKIYPNPSTGQITIEAEGIEYIKVLNLQGKQIYTGNEKEIDLGSQPKGIYIIKVRTSKGVAVEKVVKE